VKKKRTPAPAIGPRIQATRKKQHLSLEQLAARSGVSKSLLSQIERGEANPTFATLWNLTRALDLEFSDLIGMHSSAGRGVIETIPAGLIPDLDRSNNQASFAFGSGAASGINLAVSFKDFTATPNPGLEGRPLTLAAVVRNTGTVAASNVEVAFYNGDPTAGGLQIGSTQIIAALAPGASTTSTLVWDAVPDSTDKLLYVVVDPANKITEFSKTDNSAFNVVPILSLTDLAIASGDMTTIMWR